MTRNTAKITWSEPSSDGGSRILGYLIETRTPYNPRWMKVTRSPVKGFEYMCTELVEGDEQEFRVVAVNEAGYSKPSNSTPLVKIKDLYGQSMFMYYVTRA